ncbi:MAG: FtsX-like permease family protein [Candidatus Dormibacteria bacterium]
MIPLLWRRTALVRLVLGIVALALGGGALLGTQLAAGALQQQAVAALQLRAGAAQYDIQPFARRGFTRAQVMAIARLKAVAVAAPLEEKADLAELPSKGFRQVVLVATSGRGVALRPLPLVRGRRPRRFHQVAVSQNLSPGISISTGVVTPGKVGLGQTLRLVRSRGDSKFDVVGVVANSSPGAPFTSDAVYVTRATANKLFGEGLEVTDVAVRLQPRATASQLLSQLAHSVHTQYTVSNPRAVPDGDPVGELQPILDGITALSLLLAFVVIATTFSSLVLDRRREIGLLRLAGASRDLLFRSFLREALAASALGAALGVGVGYALAAILIAISIPAGTRPPPQLQADASWSVAAFLLVLAVGVLAALLPALQVARMPPLTTIRPEPSRRLRGLFVELPLVVIGVVGSYLMFAHGGSIGEGLGVALAYLAICAGLLWAGPYLVRGLGALVSPLIGTPTAAVSARARTRPERSSLAMAALFVSMATAIGLVGLSSAALSAGELWVNHLFVGQYLLVSPVVQSPKVENQVLRAITAATGQSTVVASAPVRFVTARVGHQAISLGATPTTAYALSGALQFLHGGRTEALAQVAAGKAVLLPLELADSLHAGVGSRLKVVTTTGSATFKVAGIVAHTLPGPAGEESVMVDSAAAQQAFGSAAEGFDLVQLKLRGSRNLQRPVALAAFRYGLEEETVATVRQGVDRGVEQDIAALSALGLVGVVIAVLAAINTVVLSAREGTRDIALLRVVGLSRRRTRRAILAEVLAVALGGSLLGIGVGIGLIAPELHVASSAALPLSFGVPWLVIVAMVLAVIVAIGLAAWFPARQLSNLDPVAALSVE